MARANIFEDGELIGWFDPSKADEIREGSWWDGSNHVSLATGSQWDHEMLYRTVGGRWVLHWWSQWQGREERFVFVDEDTAKDWLLRNKCDEEYEEYFGDIEEEKGPGRPAVGPVVQVRLPDEALSELDKRAAADGVSRAAVIRDIIIKSL